MEPEERGAEFWFALVVKLMEALRAASASIAHECDAGEEDCAACLVEETIASIEQIEDANL